MTLVRENFESVLTASQTVADKVALLVDSITLAAPTDFQFNTAFADIYNKLVTIEDWANGKIVEAEQEQVMGDFLSELFVVFTKYSAKIEVGDDSGYGISYGGDGIIGLKLTATFEGTTATKEINKSIITSEDLV